MLHRSKRSGLKNESSSERRRGRIKRFVIYGVPTLALLWTGCQRVNEDYAEMSFCWNLRYSLLSDYQYKHHVWPTTLAEIERDIELAHPGSERIVDSFGWTLHTFHPTMTILDQDKDYILVDVRFHGHLDYHDHVISDSQLAAEAEEQAESKAKPPALPVKSSPEPAKSVEEKPRDSSPVRASCVNR